MAHHELIIAHLVLYPKTESLTLYEGHWQKLINQIHCCHRLVKRAKIILTLMFDCLAVFALT